VREVNLPRIKNPIYLLLTPSGYLLNINSTFSGEESGVNNSYKKVDTPPWKCFIVAAGGTHVWDFSAL